MIFLQHVIGEQASPFLIMKIEIGDIYTYVKSLTVK